jgi:simple sugar transport system ATP-binding protein
MDLNEGSGRDHLVSAASLPLQPGTGPRDGAPPVLEMRGVTKRYPGVLANDHIDLDLRAGEIHGLLGENGAGKTTLMNILYGLVTPDEGEILLDGKAVQIREPSDAIARGISMVHQHFMLVPVLSVADNILLGEEPMAGPIFLDRAGSQRRIRELSKSFGWEVDPNQRVESLSVGWQQRVEILKALYRSARVLVLDEPTAVLTPQETNEIFSVLRKLRAEGYAIVFISHKLYEVLEIADRITVIRRGRVVGSRRPSETDEDDLAELMVGREVKLTVERGTSHPGEPVLVVDNLHARDDRRHETVRGINLSVRAGEILGIAGVAGNGQDELVQSLTGLRRPTSGHVTILGRDVTGHPPAALYRGGLAHVPADRQRHGLVMSFPLDDNLILTDYGSRPYATTGGLIRDPEAIDKRADELIAEFDIRTPSREVAVSTLSGGNQQKAIVAREFSKGPSVLILDQPTRGLDVGSIEFIRQQAVAMRDRGVAILLVSAELDEVMELSDRIAVIYRGELVATVDGRSANREDIGLLMATGRAAANGAQPDTVTQ